VSRVLIVDDEGNITDTLVKIFEGVGYEARGVYSAESARAILQTWSPHLAIIDVRLPAMNGIDLAKLMNAEYPDCRLILLSGQAETADLLEVSVNEGYAFEILAKPTHPRALLNWAQYGVRAGV
jgi:DNA-binding NtrC family response regulator